MLIGRVIVLAASAAALAACGSQNSAWSRASATNTIAAYGKFLSKYPSGTYAVQAIDKIDSLRDTSDWRAAQVDSSIVGFERYLSREPHGAYVESARDNITMRERSAAWHGVSAPPTVTALQAFLARYPTGPESDEARMELRRLAGYRAVLGTAMNRQQANVQHRRLGRRFSHEFPNLVVLAPDAAHAAYRIASTPMSEDQAVHSCLSLTLSGHPCEVAQRADLGGPALRGTVSESIRHG